MINYEIKEHLGVIEESAGGWRTELNRIVWNGKPAKLFRSGALTCGLGMRITAKWARESP